MTIRVCSVFAVFGMLLFSARTAGAEPRFLSKQYNRCSSCHYSASGGGLLTSYGRALSGQELASTKHVNAQPSPENNGPGEEAFLFGALGHRLGPVQLGISLRPSHLHFESGAFSDSRNLLMNADVEGAYRGHGWTAYGEAGRMPEIGSENAKLYSREHWISYESKRGLGIKAGRYMPAYGIHFADHTSFNRSDLGFDKYDQVYGIEVSRTSDRSLLQVSVSPGRAESIVNDDGGTSFNATGRLQVDVGPDVVVVGSGLYRDESTLEARHGAAGGAVGFAPGRRLTVWTEGDAHIRDAGGGTAFVLVNETAIEAFRGVWFKVSPQGRTGTTLSPGVFRWNLGASLLPRAHVNVNLDFYFDKVERRDEAFKTFLAQLYMYL
jgi:hypothetical protein